MLKLCGSFAIPCGGRLTPARSLHVRMLLALSHTRWRSPGGDLHTSCRQQNAGRISRRASNLRVAAHQGCSDRSIDEQQKLGCQGVGVAHVQAHQQIAEPGAPLILEIERDLVGGMLGLFQLGDRIHKGATAKNAAGKRALEPIEVAENLLDWRKVRRRNWPDAARQIGDDQLVFGWEMIIQRALADPNCLGNRVDPNRADALAVEQPIGRIEYPLPHGRPIRRSRHYYTDLCNYRLTAPSAKIECTGRCNQGLERLMADIRKLRPAMPILFGAAVMLSLGMGVRQSFGLVMQPLTRDIAITISDFTLAMAVQNLVWGLLQPVAGALAVRVGFRPIMLAGATLYVAGLLVLANARGLLGVMVGAGVFIGIALACTASGMALAVGARAVPAAVRSMVLGMITAAGSLGALLSAPIGQLLATEFGWRVGVLGFLALALGMLPAAWFAGRVDDAALSSPAGDHIGETSIKAALGRALTSTPFLVMAGAYFVCGMQLLFITTHLPSYLAICGMDPMLSAHALGVIGGFNVVGSLFFGWAGGRWSKPAQLGMIYIARSVVLGWYFMLPPTPASTLVFAALMGLLWLGVGPLVAGSVVEMFGLRWQAMIQGLAFMSHQLGSFLGAFGGGLLFDALGSYDWAWRLGVGMGITAGIVQVTFALQRPLRPAPS
jgi:predicted MFS family arabinose efflux permease